MEELEIVSNFKIYGVVKKITPLEVGHINNTFKVEGAENYILQKINKNIFKTPKHVVENFTKISNHLEKKLKDLPDQKRRYVTAFKTHKGDDHFVDAKGEVWRLLNFQEETRVLEQATSPEESFEAAKAFGKFQKHFLDFKTDLHITIKDFHSPSKRFGEFKSALKTDKMDRAQTTLWEQEFVKKNKDLITIYEKLLNEGNIPTRIVHNDAKLSNVLFDKNSGEGICVIDLDTVMPGFTFFDYGDLVRSMAGPKEDERDLDQININPKYFKALSEGYLGQTQDFLTGSEREHLLFGAKLMIYLLGMRFLTDYLKGDTYFKVEYPNHNLVRAQNQFKLLGSLQTQEKELENILKAI